MQTLDFDPSAQAVHNGAFYALDYTPEEADVLLYSIPWDVTTSYRAGTRKGPWAIRDASYQLDLYSPVKKNAWEIKIGTLPLSESWLNLSESLREDTEAFIHYLSEGKTLDAAVSEAESPEAKLENEKMREILKRANSESTRLHEESYQEVKKWIQAGKKVVTVGGDHSVSMGPIRAYAEQYPKLSVLHFDAHADLRVAFEGFEDSHASIMYNVLKRTSIQKLVQVGLRDVCPDEVEITQSDRRVKSYFDWEIKEALFEGKTWAHLCREMISHLTQDVYISFDIDGLDPKLCPNTGTPVPGGLEFEQAAYLIHEIKKSGRRVVGADLVEVAPSTLEHDSSEWDGNVGARMLYQLILAVSE
jgi:agmatinase